MSVFPKLPVLERIQSLVGDGRPLRRACLVCVQHLLDTTGSLFEALIQSGLPPHELHVLGKAYSSNPRVARMLGDIGVRVYESSTRYPWGGYDKQLEADATEMWRSVASSLDRTEIDRIIVLDDGAHATATAPADLRKRIPMVAVEQTMSGLYNVDDEPLPMPVIAVASSAAKKVIEPPMICEAAFRRALRHRGELDGLTMGVIGAGSIGLAILRGLVQSGHAANVFDPYADVLATGQSIRVCMSAEEVLRRSDVLWGCAGVDVLAGLDLQSVAGTAKTLISCSSSDREFQTVLRRLNGVALFDGVSRLSDVQFECDGVRLDVRRGGFPVNFDGSAESVPAEDIQVTRALLFAGVMQACRLDETEAATWMLSPTAQRAVATSWFAELSNPVQRCGAQLVEGFASEDWITEHSGGGRFVAAS
jgi:S-adenosylhomocysteine hydrolase